MQSSILQSSAYFGSFLKSLHPQVVALYPGVAYRPTHHRSIPGYPMIASQNEYLISRFDGTVIDAKPWTLGAQASPQNDAEEALLELKRQVRGWQEVACSVPCLVR